MAILSKFKSLKLDCNAERLKLMETYQNNGFKTVNIISLNNEYKMALYVWNINS